MRKMAKRIFYSLLLLCLLSMQVVGVSAIDESNEQNYTENSMEEGWRESSEGFRYYYSGGLPLIGFQKLNNELYYFNENGQLLYGWFQSEGNWYYATKELGKLVHGLQEIDGNYYFFDENNIALDVGFKEISGNLYYFNKYVAVDGFQTINGNAYFFEDYKAVNTSEMMVDGKKYYFEDNIITRIENVPTEAGTENKSKSVQNGWVKKSNGEWEYLKNGTAVNGWQSIDGLQYFFQNKEMVHDWYLDKNTQTWYFFNGGAMQRTDITINNIGYKFDSNGVWRGYKPRWVWLDNNYYYRDEWNNNVTGWQSIDGLQYKFNNDGTMIRDWYLDTNTQTWYFFNGGVMQRTNLIINGALNEFDTNGIWKGITAFYGWQEIDGKHYYFDLKTGDMYKGWHTIDAKEYYFDKNGVMAIGKIVIDGIAYDFGQSGHLISGWERKNDGYTYYRDANNNYLKDWQYIAGKKYFFNSLGQQIGKGAVKQIIDVSEHNTVNWNTVSSKSGIDGAILRIGYGFDEKDIYKQIDKKFIQNYKECKRLGIDVGIYLYSYGVSVEDAKGEATRVVKLLKDLGINPSDLSFPIYYDLEEYHNLSKDTLTKMAVEFSKIIEAAGYKAGIYASTSYYNEFLDYGAIKNYSIWVAQYNYHCTYKNPFDGWQYSSTERIPGISGNVDMNVWF